jgi:Zn finger protein HypA/HybF involved in hydrogenase expression
MKIPIKTQNMEMFKCYKCDLYFYSDEFTREYNEDLEDICPTCGGASHEVVQKTITLTI